MSFGLESSDSKSFRLLTIYERLLKGAEINKESLANEFFVSPKSIQRDIEELRSYIAEKHYSDVDATIEYDRKKNCYKLVKLERDWFTPDEVFAISKILFDSRAFSKDETLMLFDKLTSQTLPETAHKIKGFLNSDMRNYIQPLHSQDIIKKVWKLTEYIKAYHKITFTYTKQDLSTSVRTVKPVAIMFSEHYFYLAAIDCNDTKDYPKNFRVDRIENITDTNEKFTLPYSKSFSDGEYKNKIQFMYPGELFTVRFKFNGDSLESVLDRLPTSRIVGKEDDGTIIEAEIYGEGVKRWMLSQKDGLEALAPQWFREEIKTEIQKMANKYK